MLPIEPRQFSGVTMAVNFKKGRNVSNKSEIGGDVPKPFIDRLSVVAHFDDEQLAFNVHQLAFSYLNDTTVFGYAKGGKKGAYKAAVRIKSKLHVSSEKWALLQYDPFYGKARSIRIDWIPADLGPDGLKEIHAALVPILPGGWGYFIEHGNITRIDVSVDFRDVEMDQFCFLPKQLATVKEWSSGGELQTYQHGKVEGNHTQIYSRIAKRKAQHKIWKDKEGIRIERRLKPPHLPLLDLPDLPNPFSSMNMVAGLPSPPLDLHPNWKYTWELFRLAVSGSNLETALGVLPADRRKQFREHIIANQATPWWKPEAIWSGWLPMLDVLGLVSPPLWK